MSKYIGSEEKGVKAGEKLYFENLSKSPVTVGTAVMFNGDGVYICDVLNGRVRITCGADVVEVVKCKDCRYRAKGLPYCAYFGETDFCSYGKRRETK